MGAGLKPGGGSCWTSGLGHIPRSCSVPGLNPAGGLCYMLPPFSHSRLCNKCIVEFMHFCWIPFLPHAASQMKTAEQHLNISSRLNHNEVLCHCSLLELVPSVLVLINRTVYSIDSGTQSTVEILLILFIYFQPSKTPYSQ